LPPFKLQRCSKSAPLRQRGRARHTRRCVKCLRLYAASIQSGISRSYLAPDDVRGRGSIIIANYCGLHGLQKRQPWKRFARETSANKRGVRYLTRVNEREGKYPEEELRKRDYFRNVIGAASCTPKLIPQPRKLFSQNVLRRRSSAARRFSHKQKNYGGVPANISGNIRKLFPETYPRTRTFRRERASAIGISAPAYQQRACDVPLSVATDCAEQQQNNLI